MLVVGGLEEVVDVAEEVGRGDVAGVEGGEFGMLEVGDAGGEGFEDDAGRAGEAVAGHDYAVDGGRRECD